jgi:single-strand DNA-binding protein
MLNTAIILGRLTADPEVKSAGGTNVCSFTVAVDAGKNRTTGERLPANFIRCVAWRERADFLARYFRKGSMVAVTGSIQVRSYEDKNGNKREAVEIVANSIDFTGEKNPGNSGSGYRDDVPLPPPPPERSQPAAPAQASYQTAAPADFDAIAGDDDLPF